jgi:hypothetical protein
MAFVVGVHPKIVDGRHCGHLVEYGDAPALDWGRFQFLRDADGWRQLLEGWNVSAGSHKCQFEVEEFQPNLFAIVCKTHPKKQDRVEATAA